MIHRRSDFRADPILDERQEKTANLTLLRSTVVEALEGSERLTGLTLRTPLWEKSPTCRSLRCSRRWVCCRRAAGRLLGCRCRAAYAAGRTA